MSLEDIAPEIRTAIASYCRDEGLSGPYIDALLSSTSVPPRFAETGANVVMMMFHELERTERYRVARFISEEEPRYWLLDLSKSAEHLMTLSKGTSMTLSGLIERALTIWTVGDINSFGAYEYEPSDFEIVLGQANAQLEEDAFIFDVQPHGQRLRVPCNEAFPDVLLRMLLDRIAEVEFEKVCQRMERFAASMMSTRLWSFPPLDDWQVVEVRDFLDGFWVDEPDVRQLTRGHWLVLARSIADANFFGYMDDFAFEPSGARASDHYLGDLLL